MFFRTKTIKGSKRVQLVESYRNPEGQARKRVVVSLGDVPLPEAEKQLIARSVENHLQGQSELLAVELSEEASTWVCRILQLAWRSQSARPVSEKSIDGVVVDRVESENVVEFGAPLVALEAWKQLGLTKLLQEAKLNASQMATAQLLVTSVLPLRDSRLLRICKPSLPNPEQALVYQSLGIQWKSAFAPVKSFTHPWRFCSASASIPLVFKRLQRWLWKKLG